MDIQAHYEDIMGAHPFLIVSALTALAGAGLLTGPSAQANFDAIRNSNNPQGIAAGLAALRNTDLLNAENFDVITRAARASSDEAPKGEVKDNSNPSP